MHVSLFKKISIMFFLLVLSVGSYALAEISVIYQKDLLIERGWVKYLSFIVENTGDVNLHKVNALIEGTYSDWFEFQENKADIILSGERKEFIAKVSVPYDINIGDYKFSLNVDSDETLFREDFTVRTFESEDGLMLYQINGFRARLSELEDEAIRVESDGNNLTSAKETLYQVKNSLDFAEEQVRNKMYIEATDSIREIEKMLKKAEYDISNPIPNVDNAMGMGTEKIESISLLLKDFSPYLYSISIILLVISIIYLIKKIQIKSKVRVPNLGIKEMVVDNKRLREVEQEIGKVKESQSIIEEEYKNSLVSKESYDELRVKYQETLLNLEAERKRLRGY